MRPDTPPPSERRWTDCSILERDTGTEISRAIARCPQVCPFTKQPLRREQLTLLTHANYERFADKIIRN